MTFRIHHLESLGYLASRSSELGRPWALEPQPQAGRAQQPGALIEFPNPIREKIISLCCTCREESKFTHFITGNSDFTHSHFCRAHL